MTIDWRGQGKSPTAAGGYDMDTLTDDAIAVIEQLGLGAVHYVGLSMGGFVGMRLAARRPDLLRSLVLLDTSAGPEDPDKVSSYRLLAMIYGLLGMGPVRSRVEPIMFGPTFLAELDRITAPTLVVVGAHDIATPVAKAEVITRAISGARLEIVPDSGHSSTIEQPKAVGDLIESFVEQH